MLNKPKYVREYKDRHGVFRLEFRRQRYKGWSLRQPLRSEEFWEDYNAALVGNTPPGVLIKQKPKVNPLPTSQTGSLRWLCEQYKSSQAYKSMMLSSKKARAGILDRLCEKHGDKSYAQLKRKHIMMLRDQLADRPAAANGLVKALRQVYKYAIDYEIPGIEINHARDVPNLPSNNPDGFHAWTPQEVQQYEKTHPVGTKARLALALFLYTGQRRGDIVDLGRQHVRNRRIEFTQQKGRKKRPVKMSIPIIPELQRIIDVSPCGDLTFLVTAFNKPYTSNGFGNWFRRMCNAADLPQCSAHGLRKASASRLAELGCTDLEIMAITGHRTIKEVQRYTASARQFVLADNAAKKMEAGHNKNKSV